MSNDEKVYEYPRGPEEIEGQQPGVILSDAERQSIEEKVKKDANKGLIQQLSGVLSGLLLLLGTLNIEFSWFTAESINAFVLFIGAGAAFVVNLYTTYKNSFSGKKAQEANRKLIEQKVVEETFNGEGE